MYICWAYIVTNPGDAYTTRLSNTQNLEIKEGGGLTLQLPICTMKLCFEPNFTMEVQWKYSCSWVVHSKQGTQPVVLEVLPTVPSISLAWLLSLVISSLSYKNKRGVLVICFLAQSKQNIYKKHSATYLPILNPDGAFMRKMTFILTAWKLGT